jgi:hypothetical protein
LLCGAAAGDALYVAEGLASSELARSVAGAGSSILMASSRRSASPSPASRSASSSRASRSSTRSSLRSSSRRSALPSSPSSSRSSLRRSRSRSAAGERRRGERDRLRRRSRSRRGLRERSRSERRRGGERRSGRQAAEGGCFAHCSAPNARQWDGARCERLFDAHLYTKTGAFKIQAMPVGRKMGGERGRARGPRCVLTSRSVRHRRRGKSGTRRRRSWGRTRLSDSANVGACVRAKRRRACVRVRACVRETRVESAARAGRTTTTA